MHDRYKGQTAIVTGASRGIGRAVAARLAEAGMKIAVTARSPDQLEEVAGNIRSRYGTAEAIPADLTHETEIISLFERAQSLLGPVCVLINNAGKGIYGPLCDFSTTDLDKIMALNLRGTYLCSREAMKAMMPLRRGYIINIASVVGFKGYPKQSAYTATKHGVVGMTKALAREAQEYGIRVSVINPGGVDTGMVRRSRPDLDVSQLLATSDVADTVMFLLSLSDRAAVDEIYLRRNSAEPF